MTAEDREVLTLRRCVGRAVRRLREQHQRRQDDVARAARQLGLAWTASKIAALERGDKALPAEELLVLPLVLTWAECGKPSLLDLLPAEHTMVRLGASAEVSASVLARAVRGEHVAPSEVEPLRTRGEALIATMRGIAAAWPTNTIGDYELAENAAGDAEMVAARRLGVPLSAIVAASMGTWGRGLTRERDTRVTQRVSPDAPQRTVQAARGHITRELYRELAPALARYRQAAADHDEES